MKKRLTSLLLALCLLAAFLPVTAMAETITGDGYSFDTATGTLTITTNDGTTNWRNNGSISNSNINTLVIGDSVTSIGVLAFYNCTSLRSITIPGSVTSIGVYAFYNCTSLRSITIPGSVTSIGSGAFECCSSLESITIPEGVTSIDTYAFAWCEKLTNITIPSSVTSIGDSAFHSCASLSSITIPSSVTSIDLKAFFECNSLESIIIPDSVESIGAYAFAGCTSLRSITIPENIDPDAISANAFDRCRICETAYEKLPEAAKGKGWDVAKYWDGDWDQICDFCGESIVGADAPVDPHTHTPGPWKWDAGHHWRRCTSCNSTEDLNRGTHQFSDAWDTTCNVCGYTRTAPAEKPNTGDTTHTMLWAGLFLTGIAVLYWQLAERKKEYC